jgi:hypothetical protein
MPTIDAMMPIPARMMGRMTRLRVVGDAEHHRGDDRR